MSLLALAAVAWAAGVWTNEEQRSFALEAGKPAPAWVGLRVSADGSGWRGIPVDPFGAQTGPARALPAGGPPAMAGVELRPARPFRCWAAVPKRARKADPGAAAGAGGSADWWGKRDIALHDQGGRAELLTDEAEPQRFTLKMRNVVWPSGPNQPSLVLYVLTPEGGERAVAYSWADPQAKRVGINIRTIQASCSLSD